MSKGSRPRPFSVTQEEYCKTMDTIFGKRPVKVPYVYKPEEKEKEVIAIDKEKSR
mgnify:CR=1 FL=1